MQKPRGRPPFRPTAEQRERVAIAAGAGMSHEEIALAIGIARMTLEKYFEHELSIGAYQRRVEVLESLHAAAVKGNVTAAREYLRLQPAIAAPPAEADRPPDPVGLKAQRNEAAKTAQVGSEWAGILPGPSGRH